MIPTDKQIQWLGEQCGLVHINNRTHQEAANSCEAMALDRPVNGWYFPDYDKGTSKLISLKETPPIDLNNLVLYAVPKLWENGLLVILSLNSLTYHGAKIVDTFGRREDILIVNTDPALALFWAIYKALGGMK